MTASSLHSDAAMEPMATSESSSLRHKFTHLEKTWSVYKKFDSLERQWSRLSSNSTVKNSSVRSGARTSISSVVSAESSNAKGVHENDSDCIDTDTDIGTAIGTDTITDPSPPISLSVQDLEGQDQLREFATQEKEHQQLEEQQEEPTKPEDPGFVIKRRGSKRPRRLMTLTKVRHWNLTPKTPAKQEEEPEQHLMDDEEVMVFESTASSTSNDSYDSPCMNNKDQTIEAGVMAAPLFPRPVTLTRNTSSVQPDSSCDESRDEQSSYQNLTERVLLSMPNHQLWETAKEDERYGEWQDAYRGAKKAMGIGNGNRHGYYSSYDTEDSHALSFPSILPPQQQESMIVFSATTSTSCPDKIHNEEREGVEAELEQHRDDLDSGAVPNSRGPWTGVELLSDTTTRECIPSDNSKGGTSWITKNQISGDDLLLISTTTGEDPKARNIATLQPVLRDLVQFRLCAVSAVVIQSWVRGKLARRAYLRALGNGGEGQLQRQQPNGASNQRSRRMELSSPKMARVQLIRKRQTMERERKSAVIIQAAYRCWDCSRDFQELRQIVIRAQRFSRLFLRRREQAAAEIQAQQAWSIRGNASSQWSFDGTGISALSFDNSYLCDEEPATPMPVHSQNLRRVVWDDRGNANPIFSASPQPPHLPPALALPPRPQSAPRSRPTAKMSHSVQWSTPKWPPRFSSEQPPTVLSRGLSPGRPLRHSRVQSGLEILKYREQKKKEKRIADGTRTRPEATRPSVSRKVGKSSLSYNSPKRTTNYKCSPLANVIPDSPEYASIVKCGHGDRSKPPTIPTRKLSLKRSLNLKGKLKGEKSIEHVSELQTITVEPLVCQQKERPYFASTAATQLQISSSICIQKVWRKYRAHLAFVALIVRNSTVVCECSNGRVSRDRLLRQKAQVMCATKAIGQVGCAGAKERLTFGEQEVAAEWENVVYVNFQVPGVGSVSTFSTLYVLSTIQRTMTMECMSRKQVFMLIIKSALMQHLSENSQKATRLSMLERSLMRRRAPVEKDAAIQVQKIARRMVYFRRYKLTKASALVVQTATRMWHARMALVRARQASIKIEAFFRGELVRGIVFQYSAAAIALRGFWNGYRQEKIAKADMRATKIQAVFRGYATRQQLLLRSFCAVIVQAKVRSYLAQKNFLQHRNKIRLDVGATNRAATFIQQWWRFGQYDRMLRGLCATIIQTSYRRHQNFRALQTCRSAAIVAQKVTRGYLVRLEASEFRKAAISIQRLIRGVHLRKQLFSAANKIQTQYRRFSAQLKFQQMLWSVIVLQFQTRKMIAMRHKHECVAATFVQAFWRGHCKRLDYLFGRDCAIAIQSTYRRHRKEKEFAESLAAAHLIQAAWRGHIQRFDFHIHRGATIFLQRIWRSQLSVHRSRNAATKIQALWRRSRDKCTFQKQRKMAIQLQNSCRLWLRTRTFVALKESTLVAQRIARGFLQRRRLLRKLQSAEKIQGCVKSWLHRRYMMATRLQATLRRFLAQRRFLVVRAGIVQIQCQWRVKVSRDVWRNLKSRNDTRMRAAVRIQSWYRCNIQVCKFVINHFSVVLVQSAWRSFQEKREYQQTRKAILVLQSFACKVLAFQARVNAAIRIQCFARELKARRTELALAALKKKNDKVLNARARRKMRLLNADRSSASVLIQANWRMHQCKRNLGLKRQACFTLVSYLRAVRRGSSDRARYLRERKGIVLLQAISRGILCRLSYTKLRHRLNFLKARSEYWQSVKAAAGIKLQRQWRLRQCQSSYLKMKRGIVSLQSVCRSRRVRKWYSKFKEGTALLQARAKRALLAKNKSATLIQKNWRRSSTHGTFSELLAQVICMQRLRRRKPIQFVYKEPTLVLQKTFRMLLEKARYRKLRSISIALQWRCRRQENRKILAATIIQRRWRCYQARFNLLIKIICCTILQAVYRGHRQRLIYTEAKHRATRIQRAWKKTSFLKSNAAASIQRTWHTKKAQKKCKVKYDAAVHLQSMWRQHMIQSKYFRFRCAVITCQKQFKQRFLVQAKAAVLLQRNTRMYQERRCFLQHLTGAICAQSLFRKHLCLSKYQKVLSDSKAGISATILQKQWRRSLQRKRLKRLMSAAMLLQYTWRRVSTQKRYLRRKEAANCIQIAWRRTILQKQWGRSLQRKRLKRLMSAAMLLQCTWRRVSTRKRYLRRKEAANCIQIVWRRTSPSFSSQWNILLQNQWQRKYNRCSYDLQRRLVVSVQKKAKQRYQCKTTASVILQKTFRSKRDRSNFRQMRRARLRLHHKFQRQRENEAATRIQRFCLEAQVRLRLPQMRQRLVSPVINEGPANSGSQATALTFSPPLSQWHNMFVDRRFLGLSVEEDLGQNMSKLLSATSFQTEKETRDLCEAQLTRVLTQSTHSILNNTCIQILMTGYYRPQKAQSFTHYIYQELGEVFGLTQTRSGSYRCLHGPSAVVLKRTLPGCSKNFQVILRVMKRNMEILVTGRSGVVASFTVLASLADQMNRPFLALSFWALGVSVLTQGCFTNKTHLQIERAAILIQTRWRCYYIAVAYRTKRRVCIVLQNSVRNWQVERKNQATLKIQDCFRRNSTVYVVSTHLDPKMLSMILNGQMMIGSKTALPCYMVALIASNINLQTVQGFVQSYFFTILLTELWKMVAQILHGRDVVVQRQRKVARTMQCAFKYQQQLQTWKADFDVQCLISELKAAVLEDLHEDLTKEEEKALVFICVDFIREEDAAKQIQVWWSGCLQHKYLAARLLQSWLRGIHQKSAFSKSRIAAMAIQRYTRAFFLAKNKKEHQKRVDDMMKALLGRRVQNLSAVILQRWYRMVTTQHKFYLLLEENLSSKETNAALCIGRRWKSILSKRRKAIAASSCIARWWRRERSNQEMQKATVALAIREYCQDRQPASQALAAEDRLLGTLSSEDNSFDAMDLAKFHISEASRVAYEDELPIHTFCTDDVFPRITESDPGMEVAVKDTNSSSVQKTNSSPYCCGFEMFYHLE